MTEEEYARYIATPEGAAERKRIEEAFPPKPPCSTAFLPGETLKQYFERLGTPADPAVVAEYERSMREDTIPKIEADLKEQARRAHYLRLGISAPQAEPSVEMIEAGSKAAEAEGALLPRRTIRAVYVAMRRAQPKSVPTGEKP